MRARPRSVRTTGWRWGFDPDDQCLIGDNRGAAGRVDSGNPGCFYSAH
jgi:hypothetical protein